MTIEKPDLNEAQQRHVAVSIRHVAELFDEAERILTASRATSPFRRFATDVQPWQAAVVADFVQRIRQKLMTYAERLGIDAAGSAIDVRHALNAHAIMADISVTEMRPRYLRGYGEVDARTAEVMERLCDDLEQTLTALQRFLMARTESFDERIARLSDVPFSRERLALMAAVIDRYGLIEFRPAFNALLGRIEERVFHIALFGRVSSGKSSLINALIGAPLLPVGVSPITAIPTRVRSGEPAEVIVRIEDGQPEHRSLDELAEFASQERNPGNRKRVSRLEVVCPSPRLPAGVELVDTPGIGALATSGASETLAYLPRADMAILLVDVGTSIGVEELMLVRMLADIAVPVRIVISKADLVDSASRERMRLYVEDAIRKELGITTAVGLVSSVPAGRALLFSWVDAEIQPLLANAAQLREQSINRIAEALRENLVAQLRIAQRGRPQVAETAGTEQDEARKQLARLRDAYHGLPERIRTAWRDALQHSATEVAAAWKAHHHAVEARPIVSRHFHDEVLRLRRAMGTELHQLEEAMAASVADEQTRALLTGSWPGQELEGFPILDSAAILPEVSLPPPMISAGGMAQKRALDALQQRFDSAVATPLRAYGTRLREWAQRRLQQLETPFASLAGAMVSPGGDHDAAQIAADLAALEFEPAATERSHTG